MMGKREPHIECGPASWPSSCWSSKSRWSRMNSTEPTLADFSLLYELSIIETWYSPIRLGEFWAARRIGHRQILANRPSW